MKIWLGLAVTCLVLFAYQNCSQFEPATSDGPGNSQQSVSGGGSPAPQPLPNPIAGPAPVPAPAPAPAPLPTVPAGSLSNILFQNLAVSNNASFRNCPAGHTPLGNFGTTSQMCVQVYAAANPYVVTDVRIMDEGQACPAAFTQTSTLDTFSAALSGIIFEGGAYIYYKRLPICIRYEMAAQANRFVKTIYVSTIVRPGPYPSPCEAGDEPVGVAPGNLAYYCIKR